MHLTATIIEGRSSKIEGVVIGGVHTTQLRFGAAICRTHLRSGSEGSQRSDDIFLGFSLRPSRVIRSPKRGSSHTGVILDRLHALFLTLDNGRFPLRIEVAAVDVDVLAVRQTGLISTLTAMLFGP